jgi:hypothetical protein
MKIGIFGIDSIQAGKANVKDERVDALAKMFNSGKKVLYPGGPYHRPGKDQRSRRYHLPGVE